MYLQKKCSHKSSHKFLLISFSVIEDIVLIEIMKKCIQIPLHFLSFKRNTIWTGVVGSVMSLSAVCIDKKNVVIKVAINFY